MRTTTLAVLGGLLVLPATAVAAPFASSAPQTREGVAFVQERFIPRIFGGGEGDQERRQADMALRIEQLEQQVRMLTGQVEQLTFTVRRLEAALGEGGGLPRQRTDAPAAGGNAPTSTARLPVETGPIDLSALNRGEPQPQQSAAEPTRRAAAPTDNPALDEARALFQTGRYAMAAQQARRVLTDNPAGPVAGEARYLLGESLLAQGSYRSAANLFLENYTSDPNGARAPASLLKLSSALNGLGEREAACSSLDELFGAYPNVAPDLRAAAERERAAANCS